MNKSISTQDRSTLRSFGLSTSAIVVVLFGLVLPWLLERSVPRWPWLVAGILGVWALLWPATLSFLYRGWLAIGEGLGWVNSRIILVIIFYLLIMPIGLIMRLFGSDPMRLRFDEQAVSYRIPTKSRPKDHLERPF